MEEAATPTPKSRKRTPLVIALVALALLLCAGLGYLWWKQITGYQRQTADLAKAKQGLEKDLTDARSQAAVLKTDNTDLQKQVERLKSPVKLPLNVSLQSGTEHFGSQFFPYGASATNDFVLIPVTVKNNSGKEGYLTLTDFKLKDSASKVYPLYSQSAVGGEPRFTTGVDGLPGGYVELKAQTLAPGETVNGTLIFYAPKDANQFKLTYGSQSFDITIK